jgi:hypothetical protein
MSNQRRDRFPEGWLSFAIIFFLFGFLSVFLTPFFQSNPTQLVLYQAGGIIIMALSGFFGITVFIFGLIVWTERRRIVKDIKQMLGSINIESSPIQSNRPSYLLANSFDREVMATLSQVGGDLRNTELILGDEALLKKRDELIISISKLITLGLLSTPSKFPYYRVFLTTRGLDALNAPAALFISNVPSGIWEYVFQMKLNLSDGEWSGAAISMANSLQSMLIHRIEEKQSSEMKAWNDFIESLDEKWDNIVKKPLGKWQLGDLHFALRRLGEVKQTTFEDLLIAELISMRNKVHPPEEGVRAHPFLPKDAALMDMYLDILLQMWYGPQ